MRTCCVDTISYCWLGVKFGCRSACDKICTVLFGILITGLTALSIWWFWRDIVYGTTGYKFQEQVCSAGMTMLGGKCIPSDTHIESPHEG